ARELVQADLYAEGQNGDWHVDNVRLAMSNSVTVRFEERLQVDRAAGTRDHQGVVALIATEASVSLEELLGGDGSPAASGLLVLLDGVEDPQNLGAIIRTALAAGAQGG